MKLNKMILALSMGLAVVACNTSNVKDASAQVKADEATSEEIPAQKTAADFQPTRQELKDVSYLVGVNFGSFIKGYNFGDLDMAQIQKGMNDFLASKQTENEEDFVKQFRVDPNKMNELFNNYLEKRRELTIFNNKEEGEKYLAKNIKKAGVQVTPEGLQYRIISEGSDVKPAIGDKVEVKYKGTFINGEVFDQTTGDETRDFTLSPNGLIKAWVIALPLIGEGGEIEIAVPYELAYGEYGNRNIEPAKTLLFNINLVSVEKKVVE